MAVGVVDLAGRQHQPIVGQLHRPGKLLRRAVGAAHPVAKHARVRDVLDNDVARTSDLRRRPRPQHRQRSAVPAGCLRLVVLVVDVANDHAVVVDVGRAAAVTKRRQLRRGAGRVPDHRHLSAGRPLATATADDDTVVVDGSRRSEESAEAPQIDRDSTRVDSVGVGAAVRKRRGLADEHAMGIHVDELGVTARELRLQHRVAVRLRRRVRRADRADRADSCCPQYGPQHPPVRLHDHPGVASTSITDLRAIYT